MADIPNQAFEFIQRWWHAVAMRWALPFAVFIGVLVVATSYGAEPPTWYRLGTAAGLALVAYVSWRISNRIPRVPKNHVGILIGIVAENEKHDRQVRLDFVGKLRLLLEADASATRFHLLELPEFLATRCQNAAGATMVLAKARGHFMIFGTVRRRQIAGSEAHLLSFEGIVRHAEVSSDVQHAISADFRSTLPRRVHFPVDNDVFAFEVTSEWADVAARYIIALAAFASGDVWYAETLLLGVEQRLRTRSPRHAPLRDLALKLPERFEALYDRWLGALGRAYVVTRDRTFVIASEEVAHKLLERNPQNYRALLQVAICELVLRRDIGAAKAAIMRCRRVRDSTWRYSLAFLLAYEGQTRRAREEYNEAFNGRLRDVTVPVQVEEFIQLVIDAEPDKVHLYFFTGLLNYRVKEDMESAPRDFAKFLSLSPDVQLLDERRLAAQYIVDIDRARRDAPVA